MKNNRQIFQFDSTFSNFFNEDYTFYAYITILIEYETSRI